MKLKSIRAEIAVATILLIVGVFGAGGFGWYKITEPARNKKAVARSAQAAAATEAQARAELEKVAAVAAAAAKAAQEHAQERQLRDTIDRNASGFVEGAKIALQTNPTPTQAEIVAIGLLDSAGQALGQPLTAQQREVWTKTVAGLIARNVEAEQRVQQLTKDAAEARAALGEVRARAQAADNNVSILTKQLDEHTRELVKTAAKAADLTAKNKLWADGEQTLWGRLKAVGFVSFLLLAVATFLSLRYRGMSSTVKDAVALGEHMKKLAIDAGQDAKKLEEQVSDWWENDTNAEAKFAKIKSQLRL